MIVPCENCKEPMEKRNHSHRFCKDCAKTRRREKFVGYHKNRSESSKKKLKEYQDEYKKLNRAQGKCSDCKNPPEEGKSRCASCREKSLLRRTRYNRKLGHSEAGQSQQQKRVYDIIKDYTEYRVLYNNRKMIRNPNTDYGLELDIYIPRLKLAFEVDGIFHREPVYGEERLLMQQANDKIKDEQCRKNGILLIRISTDEINDENIEGLTLAIKGIIDDRAFILDRVL
jgi:hypothetical protein